MSKIAFMFPGQGTQVIGMGKDIYDKYDEAKKVYDKASEILNIDMCKLCFEGVKKSLTEDILEDDALDKTENTQIAIAVRCLASLEVL